MKQLQKINNSIKGQYAILKKLEEKDDVIKYINTLDNISKSKESLKGIMIANKVGQFDMDSTLRWIIKSVRPRIVQPDDVGKVIRNGYKSLKLETIKVRS